MGYKDNKYNNNRHHDNNAINNSEEVITEELKEEDPFVDTTEKTTESEITDEVEKVVEPAIKEVEEKKEEEVKMEEEKKEVVTNNYDKAAIDKEIAELEGKIKSWEAQINQTLNHSTNAVYHDNIMSARKRIHELKSTLPNPITIEPIDGPKVGKLNPRETRIKLAESITDHLVRL